MYLFEEKPFCQMFLFDCFTCFYLTDDYVSVFNSVAVIIKANYTTAAYHSESGKLFLLL